MKKVVSAGATVEYFQASSSSTKPSKSDGTWVTNAALTTYSATDRYLYRYSISYGSDGSVLSESDVMLLTVWGQKGDTGNKGEIGNLVYPAGKWISTSAYSVNGKAVPVVLYNDSHYMLISDISARSSGNTTPDSDTAHWKPFNEFQSVWAKIVMSEFGKIASAVFSGDYMFSQQGVDANGNATSGYSQFTDENGTAFQPNVLINFLTGIFKAKGAVLKEATISGTLNGVTGTFHELKCINSSGVETGSITFGSDGRMWFSGDLYHQGYDSTLGRGYRNYASDIWCRGVLSNRENAMMMITGSNARYYQNGFYESSVSVTLTATSGIYTIPLCPAFTTSPYDDLNGFSVNLIVIQNSASANMTYSLESITSKEVTIVNANNGNNNVHVYANNGTYQISGGHVVKMVCTAGMLASEPTSLGHGWMVETDFDNNW